MMYDVPYFVMCMCVTSLLSSNPLRFFRSLSLTLSPYLSLSLSLSLSFSLFPVFPFSLPDLTITTTAQLITQPPENAVAAQGTNATFTCRGNGEVFWEITGTQVLTEATSTVISFGESVRSTTYSKFLSAHHDSN